MDAPISARRSAALQLLQGRWIMAVMSLYILFCSGGTYIFAIYSGAIKQQLGYTQSTIDTLSFFKDLGANVGIVSGLMNEVLPAWSVLAVGAAMNVFGYVMIWMAVTHRIARPPTWQMNLYLCVGANSQTFANTGALVTVVKNFPHGRGEVLGIIKGCVGLSGAVFTQLYLAIYGGDTTGVILLIAWLPSLVNLLFMFFVRPIAPAYDRREKRNFYNFLYLALFLAAFLTFAIIVENQLHLPSAVYKAFGAVTMLIVVSNLAIGVLAERSFRAQAQDQAPMQELSQKARRPGDGESNHSSESAKLPLPSSASSPRASDPHGSQDDSSQKQQALSNGTPKSRALSPSPKEARHSPGRNDPSAGATLFRRFRLFCTERPRRGDDYTILQAIFSTDMWILFVTLTCGVGATLTAIDNMGQIGQSQGYSKASIDTCVSLISIWNFLGRVSAGFLSEILLRRYRFPRTLVLTIVLAVACAGHIMIAFPSPASLYIASIIVGLCFGAQWPLLYAIISELFGLKYFATLYNVGAIASPLGSYLLNVRVAGHFYDEKARQQSLQNGGAAEQGDRNCMGAECFKLTFVIMAMVSALGSLISIALVLRTRKFYRQDIYGRFKLEPERQNIEHQTGANGATSRV